MNDNMLFSQEALDKLRSPDRLDKMFSITRPVDWMLTVAVGVFLFAVILWSIFGSFTVKADGMGLITDSAGIVTVTPLVSGTLSDVNATTGAVVKRGDIIAHIDQAERTLDARFARHNMALSKNDRDMLGRIYDYNTKREQTRVTGNVRSNYDGVIDEVMVEAGQNISSGTPICTIRLTQDTDELSGVLYVPVDKGKRVQNGMTIQLAMSGVDVSESGSLIGIVRSVSQYPISPQSAQKNLGNSQLSSWIAEQQKGALMEVKFDLVKDEKSDSGYLWTSSVGVHPKITAGSFCKGFVVIESRPPIEKVFYRISQWLRSR